MNLYAGKGSLPSVRTVNEPVTLLSADSQPSVSLFIRLTVLLPPPQCSEPCDDGPSPRSQAALDVCDVSRDDVGSQFLCIGSVQRLGICCKIGWRLHQHGSYAGDNDEQVV